MMPSRTSAALVLVSLTMAALPLPPALAQSGNIVAVFADVWSLDPMSPEIGDPRVIPFGPVSPADIFLAAYPAPPPLPPCVCEAFALGFPDPSLGDNVDGLSIAMSPIVGFPPPAANDLRIEFSIDRTSVGVDPVITAETGAGGDGGAGDIFAYVKNAGALPVIVHFRNNALFPPMAFFLTPKGAGGPESNVDAWYSQGGFQVGNNRLFLPILPNPGFYFLTVDAATALANGLDPNVIYTPNGAAGLMPAAAYPLGGLVAGDDIDAISAGPGVLYFSLARFSPTLAANGWSPADVLRWTPAGGIQLWAPAAALGLAPTDNIDALYVWDPSVTGPTDDALSNVTGPVNQSVVGGAYFDIEAKRDMVAWIRQFSMVAQSGVTSRVWATTEGSYASKLGDPNGWTLISSGFNSSVQPEGWPTPQEPVSTGIELSCGEVRGFFIEATSSGAPALGVNPVSGSNSLLAENTSMVLRGGVAGSSTTPGAAGGATFAAAPGLIVQYESLGPPLGAPSPFTGGQAPQPGRATLDIGCSLNSAGLGVDSGLPGPYSVAQSSSAGNPLPFRLSGAPNQPIVLLLGPLNVAVAAFPGVGQVDIGMPGSPVPTAINVAVDGTSATFPDLLFRTDSVGAFTYGLGPAPSALVGSSFTLQAIIYDAMPPFIALSNACHLDIVP